MNFHSFSISSLVIWLSLALAPDKIKSTKPNYTRLATAQIQALILLSLAYLEWHNYTCTETTTPLKRLNGILNMSEKSLCGLI